MLIRIIWIRMQAWIGAQHLRLNTDHRRKVGEIIIRSAVTVLSRIIFQNRVLAFSSR